MLYDAFVLHRTLIALHWCMKGEIKPRFIMNAKILYLLTTNGSRDFAKWSARIWNIIIDMGIVSHLQM